MAYKYLVLAESFDQHIFHHLDPDTVMNLSMVNLHYNSKLKVKRDELSKCAHNLIIVCVEYPWILRHKIQETKHLAILFNMLIKAIETNNRESIEIIHNHIHDNGYCATIKGNLSRLFMEAFSNDSFDAVDMLFDIYGFENVDFSACDNIAMIACAKKCALRRIEWLLQRKDDGQIMIDIHAREDLPFALICSNGNVLDIEWFFSLEAKYGEINIANRGDHPLRILIEKRDISSISVLTKKYYARGIKCGKDVLKLALETTDCEIIDYVTRIS